MKHFSLIFVIGALIFGSGCIQMEDHLTIKADGSGTYYYKMTVPALGDDGGDDGPMTTKEGLEKFAASIDGKVELFETSTKNQSKTTEGKISFPSLEKLITSEVGSEIGWHFKNKQNHLYAKLPMGLTPDGDKQDDKEMSEQEFNQAKMFMNGLKFSRSITLPNKIVNQNASKVAGNTASWVFEINANTTKAEADNAGKVKPGAICSLEGVTIKLPLEPPPKPEPDFGGDIDDEGGDGEATIEFNF